MVIQIDPENPHARAYFQQLGSSAHIDALPPKPPPGDERWQEPLPSPPWQEEEPARRPPLDYRGGAPRSPYPNPRTPPPVMPLENVRTKGLREVGASWQASELELPMEYDDTPEGGQASDFLSPHKAPSHLSRSAAEWLASVSPIDEEGATVIGPSRFSPPEPPPMQALPSKKSQPSPLSELPPAFSEAELRPSFAPTPFFGASSARTSEPPPAESPYRPPTQPPSSSSTLRPVTQPPPSITARPATQTPSSRDALPTPFSELPVHLSEPLSSPHPMIPPIVARDPLADNSAISLPSSTSLPSSIAPVAPTAPAAPTAPPQDADEMLARALAMALAHQAKPSSAKNNPPASPLSRAANPLTRPASSASRGIAVPPSSRHDSQQRLAAAPSRHDSQQRLAAAPSRHDSQQRLVAAPSRHDSQQRLTPVLESAPSSASWRASRSQSKLPAAQTAQPLSDENQKKLEALVRALDSALHKELTLSSEPNKEKLPPPPVSDSRDDTFASEALTGQFPIISVADPELASPVSPMATRPPPFAAPSEKKPPDVLISEHTISQAAERLTAELRASLAFFNRDEHESTQEDPASMINDILDIIGGNEQQDISQATLSAILDQTLHHLQGSTARDSSPVTFSPASSSIQENFTPASLQAYSSSVQIPSHEPPTQKAESPTQKAESPTQKAESPTQKAASSQQAILPAALTHSPLAFSADPPSLAWAAVSDAHPPISQAPPSDPRGLLVTPPSLAVGDDVFEEMFRQAMSTYLRRQYKEALQLFQECLLLRPDDPRTLYNVERLRKRIPSD